MAKQTINLGTAPSGQDGDDARTAFQKANANFDELYSGAVSQPTNAKLSAISASVWAANQLMYSTGANTIAMTPLTAAGRALLDDADAAAQRTTLGLGGTILQALQALAMTANGVPYMTSTAAMAVAASTAFGRGLWNLVDAAALRNSAGLGSAALLTATTSNTDSTSGRVLKVGDFGQGGLTPSIWATLIDDIRVTGKWYATISNGQGPLPLNSNGYLDSVVYASTYAKQTYTNVTTGQSWTRLLLAGVWQPFYPDYNAANVVGLVSQSGGAPTGSIIERGSNANGEYVKFADGTLICWTSPSAAPADMTTTIATGAGYQSSGLTTVTFPAPFVGIPAVSVSGRYVTGARGWVTINSIAQSIFNCIAHAFTNVATIQMTYIAIGRWF